MKQNKICILDIDIQGVKSILNGPAHAELNPHYLFVQPKSFGDLKLDSGSENQTLKNRYKSGLQLHRRNLRPQKVCLSKNF